MNNLSNRYHVCDPVLTELIDAYSQRGIAFACARFEASRRGYAIEVYDSLAHYGAVEMWQVRPTGNYAISRFRRSPTKPTKQLAS